MLLDCFGALGHGDEERIRAVFFCFLNGPDEIDDLCPFFPLLFLDQFHSLSIDFQELRDML